MNVNINQKSSDTQCDSIIKYLQDGNSLSQLEAIYMFGCMRLASRISDLRDMGYMIDTNMIKDEKTGKRYAKYVLFVKAVS
jgi:hypothetical protein